MRSRPGTMSTRPLTIVVLIASRRMQTGTLAQIHVGVPPMHARRGTRRLGRLPHRATTNIAVVPCAPQPCVCSAARLFNEYKQTQRRLEVDWGLTQDVSR